MLARRRGAVTSRSSPATAQRRRRSTRVITSTRSAATLLTASSRSLAQQVRIKPRHAVVRPDLVLYRALPDGIEIVRVVHGARELAGLFEEGAGDG